MTAGIVPVRDGSLTSRLAEFASGCDIALHSETEGARAAKRHLLDTIGALIAGATVPVVRKVRTLLTGDGDGAIPVIGLGCRTDALSATYLMAVAAHALEADDGFREGAIHPGAVVVPAVLAAGYELDATGRDILDAIVAGYQVAALLAESLHPHASRRGFQPTGAFGVFGAAAATGRLMRLGPQAMESAFGIAASSAAGLFAFLKAGGTVKKLHPGHAAREGLWAARLAAGDVVQGPKGVFEVKAGVLQAFGGIDAESLMEKIQLSHLAISRCYIKPYPCCRHIHAAIDAMGEIMRREEITPDAVDQVVVGTYEAAMPHAWIGWGSMMEAQLSFRYVIASKLRFGVIALGTFSKEMRSAATIGEDAAKVHVRLDPECCAAYPGQGSARVTIVMRGGLQYSEFVSDATGSPERPVSDDYLFQKFHTMTSSQMSPNAADLIINQIMDIEQAGSIRTIMNVIVSSTVRNADQNDQSP